MSNTASVKNVAETDDFLRELAKNYGMKVTPFVRALCSFVVDNVPHSKLAAFIDLSAANAPDLSRNELLEGNTRHV